MEQQDDFCMHIDDLHDFVNEKLSSEDIKIITKHLASCQMCRSDIEDIRFIKEKYPNIDTKNYVKSIPAKELDFLIEKTKLKQETKTVEKTLFWNKYRVAASIIFFLSVSLGAIYSFLYLFPTNNTENILSKNNDEEESKQENKTYQNKVIVLNDSSGSEEKVLNYYTAGHGNNTKKNQAIIVKKEIKKIPTKIEKEEKELLLAELNYFDASAIKGIQSSLNFKGNDIDSLEQQKEKGIAKYKAEKYQEASLLFKDIVEKEDTNSLNMNAYLAMSYFGNRQEDKALPIFEKLLKFRNIRDTPSKASLICLQMFKIHLSNKELDKAKILLPKLTHHKEEAVKLIQDLPNE